MNISEKYDYLILGGGFIGPILQDLLSKKNKTSLIVEKSDRIGGHCKSIILNGFTFDLGGPHIIFGKNRNTINTFKNILGDQWITQFRDVKINLGDQYINFPFENGIYELPASERKDFLLSLIESRIHNKNDVLNFEEWLLNSFGKWACNKYFLPYNKKIWKRELNAMDMSWTQGRVPLPPLAEIISAAMGELTHGNPDQLNFGYPKMGGIETFAKSFAQNLEIKYEVSPSNIIKDSGKLITTLSNSEIIISENIISTIPLIDLSNAYTETPESIKLKCESLDYNGLIVHMFGWKDDRQLPLAIYNPSPSDKFHRITLTNKLSPCNCPPGFSGAMVEETFPKGFAVTSDYIDRSRAMAWSTLCDLLDVEDSVMPIIENTHVSEFAYVVNNVNNKNLRNDIINYFQDQGFYLAGRYGKFQYINMDQAFEEASNLINQIN